jgi:hypothetical protein
LGYNYARHAIDFFNLTKATFLHSIRLTGEGPGSTGNLSQLRPDAGLAHDPHAICILF